MEYTDNQKIIIDVLQSQACFSDSSSIEPKKLISACGEKGLSNIDELEKALVSLIDMDIIEYDMDGISPSEFEDLMVPLGNRI